MLKEAGLEVPKSPEFGQGPLVHVDEDGGALDPSEPQTFVYDEWDFRAGDYKPRWCIVRQKGMAEGDASYYGGTLHSYAPLVNQVKRQFELLVPEMMRKVRKLQDGDEIDIDDVIEAFVDIRTGAGTEREALLEAQQGPARRGGGLPPGHQRLDGGGHRGLQEGGRRLGSAGRSGGVHGVAEDQAERGDEALLQAHHRPREGGGGPADQRAGGDRRHVRHLRLLRLRS